MGVVRKCDADESWFRNFYAYEHPKLLERDVKAMFRKGGGTGTRR